MLLSGEPGIGKSRLTAALLERLADEPHTRLRYFCSPQHTDSAFYPIIGQMERAAGFAYDDDTEAKLDKLEALASPEDLALLAELLSLPTVRYPASTASPQRKKEQTFTALLRQVEALARSRPALMLFEDLHWIDPSSRELLDRTIERAVRLPSLLVLTFRPIAAADESGHTFTLTDVFTWAAALYQLRREAGPTMDAADAALTLANEHIFPFLGAHATTLRGWALVQQGCGEEGIDAIRRGIDADRRTGANIEDSHWLALLAEACSKTGNAAEGLRVVAEALAHVARTERRQSTAALSMLVPASRPGGDTVRHGVTGTKPESCW